MELLPPSFSLANIAWFTLASLATGFAIVVHRFGLVELLFNPVDRKSKRHGGELVAAVLKEHGVKFVFTLCGGHISPILVACNEKGIRVIDTRHEVTCVFAADAVARLSGTVGVACVTAGPGLTNTVTAVKNAVMAESPVLLLGGASATVLKGRGSLQDIDQMALFKPLCKFSATVTRVRDIIPTIKKAIQAARSGVPGPVFVELPIDCLYPYEATAKEMLPKREPKTLQQKIGKWYIDNYLNRLFGGAWKVQDLSPLPATFPVVSQGQVRECADLLRRAKKPVFVIGSQSTLFPDKMEELKAGLTRVGVPCFLGGMARGLLGQKNRVQVRQRRGEALEEADVIVLAGSIPDFRLQYGRAFGRKAKVVSINRSKSNLTLNTDVIWKPHRLYHGDPGLFLLSLTQALSDYQCPAEWLDLLASRDAEKEATNLEKSKEPMAAHLNPLHILHTAEEVMSDNTILVADGGDFVGSAAYILCPRGPLLWLDPGPFGTLGVGGGFALGAKLCKPDMDVWIVYGDGALGYSVAEFDTFTRHNVPVVALVGNDACWSQIARDQIPRFSTNVGCMLAYCNYETVAKGYGGEGFKLDENLSDKDIKETLIKAQKLSREGRSVLLNCLIGTSDFRKGSISV